MDNTNIWFPLLLAFLAGICTVVGSSISLLVKKPKKSYLQFSLGLSAGVMIYISFVEIMAKAIKNIGFFKSNMAFFGGIFIMMLLDFLIPHEYIEEKTDTPSYNKKVMRAGMFMAIGIAIHNFPEGMAVFISSMVSTKLGISLAFAIAIHNIPEGIAIAMPIFYTTKNRMKAIWYSFLSGIAEPLGAIIGLVILMPFIKTGVLSYCLAAVAGIMIFISFDELLPLSYEKEGYHISILGIILGMLIMALSIHLF